jgi:hypothetical protein
MSSIMCRCRERFLRWVLSASHADFDRPRENRHFSAAAVGFEKVAQVLFPDEIRLRSERNEIPCGLLSSWLMLL